MALLFIIFIACILYLVQNKYIEDNVKTIGIIVLALLSVIVFII